MLLTVCIEAGRKNLNSYLVDRTPLRFPQMDVWPVCRFGRAQ